MTRARFSPRKAFVDRLSLWSDIFGTAWLTSLFRQRDGPSIPITMKFYSPLLSSITPAFRSAVLSLMIFSFAALFSASALAQDATVTAAPAAAAVAEDVIDSGDTAFTVGVVQPSVAKVNSKWISAHHLQIVQTMFFYLESTVSKQKAPTLMAGFFVCVTWLTAVHAKLVDSRVALRLS